MKRLGPAVPPPRPAKGSRVARQTESAPIFVSGWAQARQVNVSTSPVQRASQPEETVLSRLRLFFRFWDARFEDLNRRTWGKTVYRDFSAGLIVAMTAIPMAMGFAMASGLRPEYGIVGGAVACLVGRTWGGSKYQVYGPTAAFIPIIYAMMQKYDHGFLVLVSVLSGLVLLGLGLKGLGKLARFVPHSIVIGFTVGIAVAIAMSDLGETLGYRSEMGGGLVAIGTTLVQNAHEFNIYALGLALLTFALTTGLLKISIYIPAPLIALAVATLLSSTVLADEGIILIADRYGAIPNDFFVLTLPSVPALDFFVVKDIIYFVVAVVFISGVESLLCSSMADRLANNRKTPFNPDKEFFGQGMVQIITPLIQGMPCTGALARTATSIKLGAVTPLAGYFKGVLELLMAYYLATYLELVPMACIGGILLWVAVNMVKKEEIRAVLRTGNPFHVALMAYTAIMVPLTDFLTGVLTALIIYAVLGRYFDPDRGPRAGV